MARRPAVSLEGDSRWAPPSAVAREFSFSSVMSVIQAHPGKGAAPGLSLNRHGAGASFYSERVGVP